MYIYERPDWPSFTWDAARLAEPLAAIRHRQGRLIGSMAADRDRMRRAVEADLQIVGVQALRADIRCDCVASRLVERGDINGRAGARGRSFGRGRYGAKQFLASVLDETEHAHVATPVITG